MGLLGSGVRVVSHPGRSVADMDENEPLPVRRRRFVRVEAIAEIFATAPPVDGARLRDDLDAVADQDITPNA